MPTVFRSGGFRVLVFLPVREHGPPHVHVRTAAAEVVIELATGESPQLVRTIAGMRSSDVAAAFRLVEANADYLLDCWRRYHG